MENAFEQVKVVAVTDKKFTDKNTGEVKTYCACTSQSTHNEFFIFNCYDEKPEVGSVFGMFLTSDRYLKPRVIFQRLK